MPTKDPSSLESLVSWLILLGIGAFAGFAKYANTAMENKSGFSWWFFLCQLVVSSFSGWVGGLAFELAGFGWTGICFGAGLSGYLGVIALKGFWRIFVSKVGASDE